MWSPIVDLEPTLPLEVIVAIRDNDHKRLQALIDQGTKVTGYCWVPYCELNEVALSGGRYRESWAEHEVLNALHESIRLEAVECAAILLKQPDLDINRVTYNFGAPLHIAASCESPDVAVKFARMLLDRGAARNVSGHLGLTPLHIACRHGAKELVQLLVDKRNVHMKTLNKTYAHHEAVGFDNAEALKVLFEFEAQNDMRLCSDVLESLRRNSLLSNAHACEKLIRQVQLEARMSQ